jgi:hypothetical protein
VHEYIPFFVDNSKPGALPRKGDAIVFTLEVTEKGIRGLLV